jgi:hypothetical protein
MDALLRKWLTPFSRNETRPYRRRIAARQALRCDALEDRCLLSTAALGAMGWPSHMAAHHVRGGFGAAGRRELRHPGAEGSTTPSTSPPSTPTPPAPNSQLQADFKQLQTDTQAILAKSQVTPAEQAAVRADFQAINKAATSAPSTATVQALQAELKTLQGVIPTTAQQAQVATDFTAMIESRGVTDTTLINQTISDVEAIVTSSNITSSDLATLAGDQAAIQTALGTTSPPATPGPGFPGGMGGPVDGLGLLLGGGGMPGGGMFPGGPAGAFPGGGAMGHGMGRPFGGRR